jgi:hypothetical protein
VTSEPVAAWRATTLTCLVAAVCLPVAARWEAGSPGALVHVRWQAAVGPDARHALEAQFRLADGEHLEGSTWRYDLLDPSSGNIRALVRDPAVADTHHLDRTTFALDGAERTARRGRFARGDALVMVGDVLARALVGVAALVMFLGLSARVAALGAARRALTRIARDVGAFGLRIASTGRRTGRRIGSAGRDATVSLARFLERGVPEVHAETAGLFRIAFAAAVVTYFAIYRVDATWLARTFDSEVEGALHARVLEWLAERQFLIDLIHPWLMTFGGLFLIGAFTRATYALFVLGVLAWAYVAMSVDSTHPHAVLVLTIVALLPARWNDAWSVDAVRRRRARAPALLSIATKAYGYSTWVPILTLGIGFAAAAWAKLTVPPTWTSWVLNGTVKYHLVTDSAHAPIGWGVQLVRYPNLAILLSLVALAVEALVITAAFSRNERWRLGVGITTASLFAGIGLFMGIVWPGWWIPLIAFLPWRRWPRRHVPAPAEETRGSYRRLTVAQLTVVVAVVLQQVIVSALKLERAPMFSWYDMYSRTYTSTANYNTRIPPEYHIVVAEESGRVQLRCQPHDELVRDFEAAVKGETGARRRVWRALRGCGADPTHARDVRLIGRARTYDWNRLEFVQTYSIDLGPLIGQDE